MLLSKLQMLSKQCLQSWNFLHCATVLGFFAHSGRVGTSGSTRVLHCFSQLNCWNMRLVSDQLL